jgi:hypothetical protein
MIVVPATAGERLCVVLSTLMAAATDWRRLEQSLMPIRGTADYIELFQEMFVVQLACQLTAAGVSVAKTYSCDDSLFEGEIRSVIMELGFPYRELGVIARAVTASTRAALHDFTLKEKAAARDSAMRRSEPCYMCGVKIDYQQVGPGYGHFSLEHVWPRAFGGDSILENALPACQSCNNKKNSFATWGMVGIQALVLGIAPAPESLREIDKTFKYAMHYRQARRLASTKRISMKDAFLKLGPWCEPEVVETSLPATFFNLQNA